MTVLRKTIHSSLFLISSKVLQRLIGLVSVMILARLLTPDDFAIVALTVIIIYFFDMLSNVGTEQYIIQKDQVSTQDLNTAWTIDLISKFALWLILISSAGFISDYFEQPELQIAIYVMSFLLPLNALKNPGTFLLKSELNYKNLFWLSLIQKATSFFVVVIIAFWSPSFWALIIADLVGSLIFLIGSYRVHNFRPNFSLINGQEQWLFSKWLLLKGIVGYTRSQIDTLIVSKLFSTAALGQYYMARNVAMLPNHNLLAPAIEPLLAAFKTQRDNNKQLAFQVRVSLLLVSLIATPIAFFIWHFPEPIIDTLLGEQWTSSYSLLSSFAPLFFYFPILLVLEQAMIVKNRLASLLFFDVLGLVIVISTLLFISFDNVENLAFLRGILGGGTCIILILYLHFFCQTDLIKILKLITPILLASVLAARFTEYLNYSFSYPIVNFAYLSITFMLYYLIIVGILLRLFFINVTEVQVILGKLKLI